MRASGREEDHWDPIAHHVIVIDTKVEHKPVVGTLRLVSSQSLRREQKFYTEHAYDITNIRRRYRKILELSRFCIDPAGRSGAILMLIWKFTMQYIIAERFELMLGCASFHGTDIEQHKSILSYLYHNNLAPMDMQSPAVASQRVAIKDLLQPQADWDEAKHAVPTLLRGYLKIGAKITDTAIIDPVFNTVFVGIYVDARDMVVQNHTLVSHFLTAPVFGRRTVNALIQATLTTALHCCFVSRRALGGADGQRFLSGQMGRLFGLGKNSTGLSSRFVPNIRHSS